MAEIAILRNPASGRGRSASAWQRFEAEASRLGLRYVAQETLGPGAAAEQARELARTHAVVVAAGGDGTLGEVANGLLGTGAALGIVPLGTGNDFSRMLGIGTSVERAAQALAQGSLFDCDAIRVEFEDGTSRIAMNICGTGFDAAVAERINRGIRGLGGTAAYLAAVAMELAVHRPRKFWLEAETERWAEKAMLVCAANAASYGGGMRVAPQASLEDGLLDLVVVGAVGMGRFLTQFPKVFSGKHVGLPEVAYVQTPEVRVESDERVPVLADGDIVGTTPVKFRVLPGAIQVVRSLDHP